MTEKPTNSLLNGIKSDFININDRAVQYGDGIFETILCSGNKLYYWHKHYQRLLSSAGKLDIVCPDEQLLLNDIARLFANNRDYAQSDSVAIKILLTRGVSERGYGYTKDLRANRIVSLATIETAYSSILSNELLSGALFLCEHQVSINENLAGLKHLNRLENVLARNEWNHSKCNAIIDGIMLNADQYIIEGSMSNIFCVKDNELFTPDLSRSGINGIMRNVVIELAQECQMPVIVKNITLKELLNMDEIFICNSLIGIKSATNLLNVDYSSSKKTRSIFQNLLQSMNDHVKNI